MKNTNPIKIQGEIKDRGNIKWTAMMLTEHVQMLRDWQDADRYNSRPELEAADLEALQEEIGIAHSRQCFVELKIWNDSVLFHGGIIRSIHLEKCLLELVHDSGTKKISFSQIIGIRILE